MINIETVYEFLEENQKVFGKFGTLGGGVDHSVHNSGDLDTSFPFGRCFQCCNFLYYMLGAKKRGYQLKIINSKHITMSSYPTTHWFIQKGDEIIDVTSHQFDFSLEDVYKLGVESNLGRTRFMKGKEIIEVGDELFVPTQNTMVLYDKWVKKYGVVEDMTDYYNAWKKSKCL